MLDTLREIYVEIGGGLPALVIVALGFLVWQQRKELGQLRQAQTRLYDRMQEREREHSGELVETIITVRDATRLMEARR